MTSLPRLLRILAESRQDAHLIGFMFVVFIAIFTSPNCQAKVIDIRRKLRTVDDRFLETAVSKTAKAATAAVPELHEDLEGLLKNMRKV